MMLLARPVERARGEPRRVRIQARDPHFFPAFAQGYALAQQESTGQPITEDTLYGVIRRTMTQPDLSPGWKAGLLTGWFAAFYHIPCRFEEPSAPSPVAPTPGHPRPIELAYVDPHFPTAYGAGYQAFAAVVGEQPATDEHLYAELERDFCEHGPLEQVRWGAGYLAGFMAALFRVPCFVEERYVVRSLASLERRTP